MDKVDMIKMTLSGDFELDRVVVSNYFKNVSLDFKCVVELREYLNNTSFSQSKMLSWDMIQEFPDMFNLEDWIESENKDLFLIYNDEFREKYNIDDTYIERVLEKAPNANIITESQLYDNFGKNETINKFMLQRLDRVKDKDKFKEFVLENFIYFENDKKIQMNGNVRDTYIDVLKTINRGKNKLNIVDVINVIIYGDYTEVKELLEETSGKTLDIDKNMPVDYRLVDEMFKILRTDLVDSALTFFSKYYNTVLTYKNLLYLIESKQLDKRIIDKHIHIFNAVGIKDTDIDIIDPFDF